MTATIVAQQAINGIVLGSLYVLVALGLTLIYGVLVQINFAHADFVTLGAFAAYFFMHVLGRQLPGEHRRPRWWSAPCSAGRSTSTIFAPLRRKGSELLPLIATIGVSTMMQNAMLGLVRAGALRVRDAVQPAGLPRRRHVLHAAERHHHRGLDRDHRAALRLHEVHLPRQGAARGVAGSRDRRADGDQSEPPDHAHLRDRLGARRHGRRDAGAGAGAHPVRRHHR